MSTSTLAPEYAKALDAALAAFEPAYHLLDGDHGLEHLFSDLTSPSLTEKGVRRFRRTRQHLLDSAGELRDVVADSSDGDACDLAHFAQRTAVVVALAIEPLANDGTWAGLEDMTATVAYGIKDLVRNEYHRLQETG